MRFASYPEISTELQERAIAALRAAGFETQFGCSNVSSSRYVEVFLRETDDEGLVIFKLRFSDHGDRHGSDHTIRFDYSVDEVEDDFGDTEYEVSDADLSRMVNEAVSAAKGAKEN